VHNDDIKAVVAVAVNSENVVDKLEIEVDKLIKTRVEGMRFL